MGHPVRIEVANHYFLKNNSFKTFREEKFIIYYTNNSVLKAYFILVNFQRINVRKTSRTVTEKLKRHKEKEKPGI